MPDVSVTITSESLSRPPPAGAADDQVAPLKPVDLDRYELRGEHGRGGLGVVMRAFDRQLGREVALKLLLNTEKEATARFLREATITSRLQHPSIVTVFDVVRWPNGTPSYTMPLYPGRSLRAAIAEAPDLRARMALLPNALAVCEAVAHAHGRRVLHRDLKPSNVLLGELGETVVIDWGLAKSLDDAEGEPSRGGGLDSSDDATRAGAIMGTPAYMAPEQARGERVDERADIYSLGALLYHVLTGRPAYRGKDSHDVLSKLLTGPPEHVDEDLGGIPPDLRAIVKKAMARAPEARYPTAGALADDLRRFLTGLLVGAYEYSPAQLVRRWIGRHRVLVGSTGVALAVVAVVVTLSFRKVQAERSVAQAAAAREKSRADAMILTQAQTVLAKDPTEAIAWLKTYPLNGAEWTRVRAIARDAQRLGVARHVYQRSVIGEMALLPRKDRQHMILVEGRRGLYDWDTDSGTGRMSCAPADVKADLRDETFGGELGAVPKVPSTKP